MDVHVKSSITKGLRRRGVDVLTAQDDANTRTADPDLMDHATALGRVLVSEDVDMLIEASSRQQTARSFSGLIHIDQLRFRIGAIVSDLEIIAKCSEPIEIANKVEFLPL
jgi:hypothetical protein